MRRRPRRSTRFPYTTLFRSVLPDSAGMSTFFSAGSALNNAGLLEKTAGGVQRRDRKSTRLNSSHSSISYAAARLKKNNGDPPSTERDAALDLILAERSQPPS